MTKARLERIEKLYNARVKRQERFVPLIENNNGGYASYKVTEEGKRVEVFYKDIDDYKAKNAVTANDSITFILVTNYNKNDPD